MFLYLLGFGSAIFSAYLLDKILKIRNRSFFVIEMPNYKVPMPKNVLITVIEKTKSFVLGAGKIILAISIILWVLASYGPGDFNDAEQIVQNRNPEKALSEEEMETAVAAFKLENSYIGIIGKGLDRQVIVLSRW